LKVKLMDSAHRIPAVASMLRPRLGFAVAVAVTLAWQAPESARGELLYVSTDANVIVTYDISLATATAIRNSEQTFVSSNVAAPHGIAFDRSGDLFTANVVDNTIFKCSPQRNLRVTISADMTNPMGLAIDSATFSSPTVSVRRSARSAPQGRFCLRSRRT